MPAPTIQQVEFDDADHDTANEIGKRLGYSQRAYTSTSGLWGLNCLKDGPNHKGGWIIKTREFGFLFVADLEDMNLHDINERA